MEYHEEEAKEVEYSVCALVTVPDSISFRYTSLGYNMVLPVEKLKEDSGTDVIPKFYMFDTPDSQTEASAEQYLQKEIHLLSCMRARHLSDVNLPGLKICF